MFGVLKRVFGGQSPKVPFIQEFEQKMREVVGKFNFDDPAERTGIALNFVLTKQLELIGKREGDLPYVLPFSSDKARGALLGTAIAIVHREYGETPHNAVLDATITAFTLVFGPQVGRQMALQTIQDSADGNDEISDASDWAIKDTKGGFGTDSVTTPVAYYLAVSGMI